MGQTETNAIAAGVDAACATEIVDTPSFWDNPYLDKTERRIKPPSVSALTWWLEHPDMGLSHVRYDEIDGQIKTELLPWDMRPHAWTDTDSCFLFDMLQRMTDGLVKSRQDVSDALVILAHKRRYNPLLDMLENLPEWDGKPRAETLLIDFLGAEDDAYTRAATMHFLRGAIMRAYRPGCKFDECVVLMSSRQGIGKSTLLNRLAMCDDFYTDSLGNLKNKDAPENMRGKWIVEVSELESLRKSEVETVKSFLSKRVDRFREPYAKYSIDRPRRCVFVATTNSSAFLTDRTGNRRFLPIRCDVQPPKLDVFSEGIEEHIGQVWSEVLSDYRKNENLALVLPDAVMVTAYEQRDSFTVDDPSAGLVASWASRTCKPGDLVCIVQVMSEVFGIERGDACKPQGRTLQRELSQMLDLSSDFERISGRRTHSPEYGKQRCWRYAPKSDQ